VKNAKAKAKNKTTLKRKPQKYPVPEWMDADVMEKAKILDVLNRHELAASLEAKAAQLRGFNQPPVCPACTVSIAVRPKMKEALLMFFDAHGANVKNACEGEKLSASARWILETVMTDMVEISSSTANQIRYREAEGIEGCSYSESLIGASIEKWKEVVRDAALEDDDED